MNQRVLAIAAHPDDIEFLMAGTLIRLRDAGYQLHCVNVADGCCGSSEHGREAIAKIRREEAERSAARLGATLYPSICHDLEIFYSAPLLRRLASLVRYVAPRIVLTHAPQDYMEDHENTCRLAVTAAFARGMPNYPVEPPARPISTPVTVYHAQPYSNHDPLGVPVTPSLFVDVTDLLEEKKALLSCHASQKQWLDESQGLDAYLETMESMSAEVGQQSSQFEYAEGWRRHSHLGFCEESADPLAAALGERVLVNDDYRRGLNGPSSER